MTTLPSQAPLDTKRVQRSIQQLAKDATKLQLGNGCPIRRFGDVVDTAATNAGYDAFRSGMHLPAQHSIDPGGGMPVLECSIVSVPKPANGALPTLPEDPSVLPTIKIDIRASGIPADRRPASERGFEHRGSNRGGDVYLVTDRSIEGVATMWIDDNVSIVLQLTGPRAKAIAPDDLDAAIAVPLQTLVEDAGAL